MLGWDVIRTELALRRAERADRRSRLADIKKVLRGAPGSLQLPMDARDLRWLGWIGIGLSVGLLAAIPSPTDLIGVPLLVLSIYGAVYEYQNAKHIQRRVDELAENELNNIKIIDYVSFSLVSLYPKIRLPASYVDSGYEIHGYHHGFGAWSREVNDWLMRLRDGEVVFAHDASKFEPPPRVCRDVRQHLELTQILSGKTFSNDPKIRLVTDVVKDEAGRFPIHLQLQATDYLSGLCTNELSFKQAIDCSTRETIYGGLDFFLSGGGGGPLTYRGLADSECSNQVSTSTVAFTADGYLVLVDQTSSNLQSSGLVAPSGSGSLDEKDLAAGGNGFAEWIRQASQRELREELGIASTEEMNPAQKEGLSCLAVENLLIGYCVYLFRGGKPEFFFLATVGCTLADLEKKRDYSQREEILSRPFVTSETYRLRTGLDVVDEIRRVLSELKRYERYRLSCPLEMQIEMLLDACSKHPERVRQLFASGRAKGD